MSDYLSLELAVSRVDARHRVELRLGDPDAAADAPPVVGFAALPVDALTVEPDAVKYGEALGRALFADAAIAGEVRRARTAAEARGRALRLRILLHRDAIDLHALRWETLVDPADGQWLATEPVLMSRAVAGERLEDVRRRPRCALRALVAVAAPPVLVAEPHTWKSARGTRPLAPIDATAEVARAKAALGGVSVDVLATDPGKGERVTLAALDAKLRSGRYDVLYLVCHGVLRDAAGKPPEPLVYLDAEPLRTPPEWLIDGIPGEALALRIRDMPDRPRVVVLASCQSAGAGGSEPALADDGSLAALGPRLVAAGVPAVLAMQGSVLQKTVAAFMPTFFSELARHGEVDRAAAAARGVVRAAPDAWMPVVYSRLKDGRIWSTPGFGTGDDVGWHNLVAALEKGRCTPIIGPGLVDSLLGSRRELARAWCDGDALPVPFGSGEELTAVAQCCAVTQQSAATALSRYLAHLKAAVHRREPDAAKALAQSGVRELLSELGRRRRAADPSDAHAVLARLPFAIYVTANPDPLLEDALREATVPGGTAKRSPVVEFCRWKDELTDLSTYPAAYDPKQYQPSVERPLVYHLFGTLEQEDSLVVTEDDCFDYLMWVSREDAIPAAVTSAWSTHALLFLGVRADDWTFRVLLRSVLNDERRRRARKFHSVAVQLEPSDVRSSPDQVRRYVEKYLREASVVDVYWGDGADFTAELERRWATRGGGTS